MTAAEDKDPSLFLWQHAAIKSLLIEYLHNRGRNMSLAFVTERRGLWKCKKGIFWVFALKITAGLKCELILWHLEKGLEWPFCAVKPLASAYVSSLGAHLWVNKLFPMCRSTTRASGMYHRDASCGRLRVRTCVLACVAMAGSDALSVMEAWLFPFWVTRLSVHLLATSPPSTSQSSFPSRVFPNTRLYYCTLRWLWMNNTIQLMWLGIGNFWKLLNE